MKRIIFLSIIAMLAVVNTNGQGFLKQLGKEALERAKDKSKSRVQDKVDRTIDGAFDQLDNAGKKTKKKGKKAKEEAEEQVTEAADEVEETAKQATSKAKKAAQMSWNNYDFVAGDEILFEDTQEKEQLGEFPSMWDLFEGNAEIAKVDGVNCINTQDGWISPLFDGKPYLTDKCTIEMDVYLSEKETYTAATGADLGINEYSIFLPRIDEIRKPEVREEYALHLIFCACDDPDADIDVHYEWTVGAEDNISVREGNYTLKKVEHNAWHHIAISFNQRAFKIYFDNQRVANIPNANAPKYLLLNGSYDYNNLYLWKNIRIAKGAVPLYDRLSSEGKITTYGITFDSGKATIKNESMGEILRFKKLMEENTAVDFEVQGHCDNTGSAETNDKLSQQRAEAIVAKLVELGIAQNRLTAVGKGSNEPVADNSTDEGRAKNRRVVFVKK